ncbi:hypothetical protein JXA47_09535 [Candidatus Sumerlaeota bacterium]|nr:hypothetical protein [Candidatus Sumerlaeota bacterium]
MRRLPRFSLRALLIAFAAAALALAIWIHRSGTVTLRTMDPENPIEITLDTHRLLALTDLRLPSGSGESLIWRGDSSWRVIEGVDEARWVNNWSHSDMFDSRESLHRSSGDASLWTSRDEALSLERNISFNMGDQWLVIEVELRAESAMSIGPVYPLRLFLTPQLTQVRHRARATGGSVSEGGVHMERRRAQVPGDPADSYPQRLFLGGGFTLESSETEDEIHLYPINSERPMTLSIEWDRDRECPVILWRATAFDLWSGEDNMGAYETVRAAAMITPQTLPPGSEQYVQGAGHVRGPVRLIGGTPENPRGAVWQLPSLMRPYPRLTASPSAREPLTLIAPRGGSDTATIYLPFSSRPSSVLGENARFIPPPFPSVDLTLEATRCVDIDWLVDPDGAIGPTPEILIPLEEDQVLEPSREGQGYLLTARVSRDATPGMASGKLQIGDLHVPIEIEIVDWTLPARPSLRTAFELYAWNLADQSPENLRRWMEVFAENRIGVALLTPPEVEMTEDGVEVDWSRFDAAARVAIDELGMTAFFTPPGLMGFQADRIDHWGLRHGTRRWEEAWRDHLPQLEAHLEANGWRDEAVFDLWDEPNATVERVAVCEEVGELARLVREHAPRLPLYVSTTEVIPQLEASWPADLQGAVNMAVLRHAPLEAIESRPRWFTLDSMVRTWITTSLDAPRATPLVAWAFGLEGMELWSVNAWNDARQREPGLLSVIDTHSLETLGPVSAAEMGGILLYQDPEGRPLRSLTWTALGQGMEDVEILEALREVDLGRAESVAREIRDAVRAGEQPLNSDWPRQRRELLHVLQMVSQPHSAPEGRKNIAPGEASEASETRGSGAQRDRGWREFLRRKNRDGPMSRVGKPIPAN